MEDINGFWKNISDKFLSMDTTNKVIPAKITQQPEKKILEQESAERYWHRYDSDPTMELGDLLFYSNGKRPLSLDRIYPQRSMEDISSGVRYFIYGTHDIIGQYISDTYTGKKIITIVDSDFSMIVAVSFVKNKKYNNDDSCHRSNRENYFGDVYEVLIHNEDKQFVTEDYRLTDECDFVLSKRERNITTIDEFCRLTPFERNYCGGYNLIRIDKIILVRPIGKLTNSEKFRVEV